MKEHEILLEIEQIQANILAEQSRLAALKNMLLDIEKLRGRNIRKSKIIKNYVKK